MQGTPPTYPPNLQYTPPMIPGYLKLPLPSLRLMRLGFFPLALSVLVVSLFLLAHPAVAADSRNETSLSDSVEDPAYRRLIKEGLAEYEARHFDEARSLFQRAHDLNPNARTHRGIGMASFELRDYVSAVHNLSAET